MKPYYQDDAVTIYHGDCLEILPNLPTANLILTDPPYGINYSAEGFQRHNTKYNTAPVRVTEVMQYDDGSLDLTFLFKYPKRLVWGFPYIYDDNATGWLVWKKHDTKSLSPMSSPIEIASTTLWTGFKFIEYLWCGYLMPAGEERLDHPTQKPLGVMKFIITNYCDKGDIIVDPFMGSGSTLRAAKDLGYWSIGIEIEEKYCEIAAKRMAQTVMDLDQSTVQK